MGLGDEWQRWYDGLLSESARQRVLERPIDDRLEGARRFIDAHYSEALDLERVARAACLSRYHFQRAFCRTFGETPHEYLTRVRIEQARRLLRETDRSVTHVCLDVGFQSLGSFSTLFRRRVGHAPAHYRRVVVQADLLVRSRPVEAVPACFLRWFAPQALAARVER